MAAVVHYRVQWRLAAATVALVVFAFAEFSWLRLVRNSPTGGAAAAALIATVPLGLAFAISRIRAGKWKWWAVALLLLTALPLSIVNGLRCCRQCGTYQKYMDLGWGIGNAWVHLPLARAAKPTCVLRDYYGGDHRHDWGFCTESVLGLYGLNTPVSGGVIACGSEYRSRFASWYEEDESARVLVASKVASGEVTADEVRRLFGLPRQYRRVASVPPGTHALVRKAGEWMGESLWYMTDERQWPPEAPVAK